MKDFLKIVFSVLFLSFGVASAGQADCSNSLSSPRVAKESESPTPEEFEALAEAYVIAAFDRSSYPLHEIEIVHSNYVTSVPRRYEVAIKAYTHASKNTHLAMQIGFDAQTGKAVFWYKFPEAADDIQSRGPVIGLNEMTESEQEAMYLRRAKAHVLTTLHREGYPVDRIEVFYASFLRGNPMLYSLRLSAYTHPNSTTLISIGVDFNAETGQFLYTFD